jgi:DNA-binding MarR family transcriptional regulator
MTRALTKRDHAERLEYVSTHLAPHISLLLRLLRREIAAGYSWTELGLMRTVADEPRRITELAELEGLAQPTMTLLVKRLEARGLVRRERQADDQRVVLVSLTQAGEAALEDLRSLAGSALRSHLEAMPDTQLDALAAATHSLAELIVTLLRR